MISNHRNMLEVRWLSPPKALGSTEGGGKQRRQALHYDEDGDSLATIDHVDQLHLVVGHLCVVQQTSAAGAEEDVDGYGTLELVGVERSYRSVSLAVCYSMVGPIAAKQRKKKRRRKEAE
ncbi:hypothetical protein BHM03_00031997 [Ensete ventricosum]|nr:hypothetical protein BHM03_00031997 [Ensete ventricosum]